MPRKTKRNTDWDSIIDRAQADGQLMENVAPAARSLARQIDRLEGRFTLAYGKQQPDEETRRVTPDWLEKMGKAEKLLAELKEKLVALLGDGDGRLIVKGFPPPPMQGDDDGL